MKTFGIIVGAVVVLLGLAALALWLYYRAPDLGYAQLERQYARPTSRYADIGDGIRIHYLDEGKPDGDPIVLVHGFGDNGFSWDGWAKLLGRNHRVLVYDLPGHGLTRAPADFVAAPDRLADTIDRWAATIGLPRFAVAGNSLGGATAWQLAVRHPARVDRLILVDAAGWPRPPSNVPPPLAFRLMRYKLGRDLITSIDNTPFIRTGLKAEVGNPAIITDEFVSRWATLQRAPGHRPILMSVNPGALGATKALLAGITVPTLILWGDKDPMIPVGDARKFADAIPGAQVIVYPGIGHLPQIENPERSAGDTAAFLAQHPVR